MIVRPIITERATLMREKGQYFFEVANRANKKEIKDAVEKLFKVKVKDVNVMNIAGKFRRVRGKLGKSPDWKKAIVTLQKGDKIDILSA